METNKGLLNVNFFVLEIPYKYSRQIILFPISSAGYNVSPYKYGNLDDFEMSKYASFDSSEAERKILEDMPNLMGKQCIIRIYLVASISSEGKYTSARDDMIKEFWKNAVEGEPYEMSSVLPGPDNHSGIWCVK